MASNYKILILGGGTAGWMAANLFAKNCANTVVNGRRIEISVVESPEIGIVGVGEGSTPQLKALFDHLEIAESDWMPKCNATYKNGISFKGWSGKKGFEEYFHPFPAKTDRDTAQAFVYNSYLRRHNIDVEVQPNKFFLPAYLAASKRGPKPDRNFPFAVSYGYHFDAYLVGEVLKANAIKLGVGHIQATIDDVIVSPTGDIQSLKSNDGQRHQADFFVDCSGFSGVLIGKALKVPFNSFAENLFNDSAVVMPTDVSKPVASQTTAVAMSAGWAWSIPLANRTGNGYVYSRGHIDSDAAETELRASLGLLDSELQARHLKMRVGQRQQHWSGNCLAVGLSQGFIEPLEATALHLAQDTIQGFISLFNAGKLSDLDKTEFNQSISSKFEGIRDYIVCHYKVNSRAGGLSEGHHYWRDCAENTNLSPSLQSLLSVWHAGEDISLEIERQGIGRHYPVISWHCLLSGYGVFPSTDRLIRDDSRSQRFNMAEVIEFNRSCALNFKSHHEQLSHF
ncbi:MAG: tryptophan 7-halogenase [Arenicella sp.]|nr:tryptophan 7-halogenase [Arenicella sp.]